MAELDDIKTAFANGYWALVFRLLDVYFDQTQSIPEEYPLLKKTIKNQLAQALQPVEASKDSLKWIIGDIEHQISKRKTQPAEDLASKFCQYLSGFPFHSSASGLTDHFNHSGGLRHQIICVAGQTKFIIYTPPPPKKPERLAKFKLTTNFFIPHRFSTDDTPNAPRSFEYTYSNESRTELTIVTNLISQLEGQVDKNMEEKEAQLALQESIAKHLENHSLILPYFIRENADQEDIRVISSFLNGFWKSILEELTYDHHRFGNNCLLFLILTEKSENIESLTDYHFGSEEAATVVSGKMGIHIDSAKKLNCSDWITNDYSFFSRNKAGKLVANNWKTDCNCYFSNEDDTIEDLLEKITTEIFGTETSLHQILTKYKPGL